LVLIMILITEKFYLIPIDQNFTQRTQRSKAWSDASPNRCDRCEKKTE